eukprot:6237308-Amphidinium_carterae.1
MTLMYQEKLGTVETCHTRGKRDTSMRAEGSCTAAATSFNWWSTSMSPWACRDIMTTSGVALTAAQSDIAATHVPITECCKLLVRPVLQHPSANSPSIDASVS